MASVTLYVPIAKSGCLMVGAVLDYQVPKPQYVDKTNVVSA